MISLVTASEQEKAQSWNLLDIVKPDCKLEKRFLGKPS